MNDQNQIQAVKQFLSIGEAAEYLGVSIDTLRRWTKAGKITDTRSPGGHRYFKRTDLDGLFDTKYERYNEPNEKTEEMLVDKLTNIHTRNKIITETIVNDTKEIEQIVSDDINIDNNDNKTTELTEIKKEELEYRHIRPTRTIIVPETIAISIKSYENINKTDIYQTSNNNDMYNANITQNYAETQKVTIKVDNFRSKKTSETNKLKKTLLILFSIFILADIIFIILWYASPKVISPVL